jgi:hypothetical protein
LFQENDRRHELRWHKDADLDDEPDSVIWYETERKTFLSRLSLLGATESTVRQAFETWLAEQRDDWGRYADEWDGDSGAHARDVRAGLGSLDYESWKAHANQTLHTRYNFTDPYKPTNAIEEKFHDHNDSYLHIAGYGDLITIRALLEACPEVKSVKLDVSDLVNSGYYEESDQISALARKNLPFSHPLGPTVILGEGSTDLLVLKRGLGAMHPAVVDYFVFQSRRVQRRRRSRLSSQVSESFRGGKSSWSFCCRLRQRCGRRAGSGTGEFFQSARPFFAHQITRHRPCAALSHHRTVRTRRP